MAHSPETPERYVCTNCPVLSVGLVEHVDGEHQYDPPAHYDACGEEAFVEEEQYPHHHS